MLKFFHILLAIVYAFSITGMHVDMHWCEGELASVSINSMHQPGCSCSGEELSDNCCADAGLYLKVADNHSSPFSSFIIQSLHVLTSTVDINIKIDTVSVSDFVFKALDLPPPDILQWICCYII